MEKEYFKGQFNTLKGNIKKTWGKLTDDDLLKVEGDYDKVIGLIQEKYGSTVADVKEKIDHMVENFKSKKGKSNDKK